MIKFEIKVKMPFLWGKAVFKKEHWNQINLIVGPNGSGKTLLAEEIAHQFEEKGYSLRYIYQENAGQSAAINKALPFLKGVYLTWPDSDDYLPYDAIEKKV